jgi:predicted porin
MNKKLLAIAVGSAMVAAATTATAGDEPTFYAKIHVSIDSMDNGGTGDAADGIFVSSNSSRLGIKGAVDLDGGLKAVYKYEMSTNYASKGSVAGDRNAYLGLKGGFGQFVVGRHDMPFKTVGRKADLFGDTIGDNRQVARGKIGGDDYAARQNDVMMYTNKFGAVGVKVMYSPEETGKDNTNMGLGVDFMAGPVKVMFAHESHGGGNLTTNNDSTGDILTGAYKMGDMTFLAGYAQMSDVDGDKGDDGQLAGYTLGAKAKSGMNTFKLQYTSAESDATDSASTILALGVDHSLSKKTKVYAVYAAISNDAAANAGFTKSGHDSTVAAVLGEDSSGFSFGMIHKF